MVLYTPNWEHLTSRRPAWHWPICISRVVACLQQALKTGLCSIPMETWYIRNPDSYLKGRIHPVLIPHARTKHPKSTTIHQDNRQTYGLCKAKECMPPFLSSISPQSIIACYRLFWFKTTWYIWRFPKRYLVTTVLYLLRVYQLAHFHHHIKTIQRF